MAELTEKEQIVLDAMRQAGKPVRPGDVAAMTGLKSEEVSKIIKKLQEKGLVVSPKRCFYSPSQ